MTSSTIPLLRALKIPSAAATGRPTKFFSIGQLLTTGWTPSLKSTVIAQPACPPSSGWGPNPIDASMKLHDDVDRKVPDRITGTPVFGESGLREKVSIVTVARA